MENRHPSEWSSTGTLNNRPTQGWLHSVLEMHEGIQYLVRYVGSLGVLTSMRDLDFPLRSCLAKECIHRVCEGAHLISTSRKRKVDKRLLKHIAEKPDLERAGENVTLTISTRGFNIRSVDSGDGQVIASHSMPNISFASGGEQETADFVAYVAKDESSQRCCYVLECVSASQDVIATIGQAFELRFKEYLGKAQVVPTQNEREAPSTRQKQGHQGANGVQRGILGAQVGQPRPNGNPTLDDNQPALIDLNTIPEARAPVAQYENDGFVSYLNDTLGFDVDMTFNPAVQSARLNRDLLHDLDYYHGPVSRPEAEALVKQDGDFLVRQSTKDSNQFVLTGMQDGCIRHLLLIDEKGIVRTKDRRFDNVPHLIEYHRTHNLPITSAESTLLLRNPVCKVR